MRKAQESIAIREEKKKKGSAFTNSLKVCKENIPKRFVFTL